MDDTFIIAIVALGLLLVSRNASAGVGNNVVSVFKNAAVGLENTLQVWKYDPRGNAYDAWFYDAETSYGLPAGMLRRVAWQESRFDPAAISPAGAVGLMQFMPSTAAYLGFDPNDPKASIYAAAKYLRGLYNQTGSWTGALASYNWGVGNYLQYGLAAAPAETQQYAANITSDLGIA